MTWAANTLDLISLYRKKRDLALEKKDIRERDKILDALFLISILIRSCDEFEAAKAESLQKIT